LALWVLGGQSGLSTLLGGDDVDRRSEGSLLAPGLAVIGFILAILWGLALGPVRSVESRLRVYFLEDVEVTELEDFGEGDSSYFPGAGTGNGEGRNLPKRADIQLGDALRTVVQFEDRDVFEDLIEEPLYVRTLTLSVIEGEGGLTPLRRGEWCFDSDDGNNDGQVVFDEAAAVGARRVRHTVFLEATESNALPILSGLSSIQLDEVYEYADDWFQLALPEGQDLVAFRAVSDFERSLASENLDAAWIADKTGPSIYRQIPATVLTEKLRATARSVVPAQTSLAQSLAAIRGLLESRCSYSLSYENPDNLPAVENFLYAERLGHCELFAATTVMLLRTLDIPARVAYGYSGGVARLEDRVVAFRDRDFHAWAEVLVEGRGWVVFDTTPVGDGARVVAENSPGAGTESASGKGRIENLIPDLGSYQLLAGTADAEVMSRSWMPAWLQVVSDFAALYLTEICLSALALFMLLWLAVIVRARRRRSSRRGGSGGFSVAGTSTSLPGYLQRFFQLWAQRGEVMRSGQTLREFVEALRGAAKCGEEFEGLVNYTYQVRYAGGRRDREIERRLEGAVDEFEERVD
jgi:transglutaminase-like putative cysteine protease